MEPSTLAIDAERDIYTVSRLNTESRLLLESHFPSVWVEGEISNLAKPSSGHWYFSLKDTGAQIRAAMFRGRNHQVNFAVEDGMKVLARAKLSLYEPRGDYQLIVERLEPAGDGLLQLAFEKLKRKLDQLGLFAEEHKQAIPPFPEKLGVITSPTGAAIRDILQVTKRRFPGLPIVIYPTQVQGKQAGQAIANAIVLANQRDECDCLILARGGGSLEDLWAFNEEVVARAIYQSDLPIVTGVGHEIDFTIADFVADQRAATPSAAAELVTPNAAELLTALGHCFSRIHRCIEMRLTLLKSDMMHLSRRLQRPDQRLQQQMQQLDLIQTQLQHSFQKRLAHYRQWLQQGTEQLYGANPKYAIEQMKSQIESKYLNIKAAIQQHLQQQRGRLQVCVSTLDSLSPLSTLQRGYAIVQKTDQTVVRNSEQVQVGEQVLTKLAKGTLHCRVESLEKESAEGAT